jgi:hypothetical protein
MPLDVVVATDSLTICLRLQPVTIACIATENPSTPESYQKRFELYVLPAKAVAP